jgi:ribonuclease P/MRP protein subunit POP1
MQISGFQVSMCCVMLAGFGSGWDVVTPAGWASPLWLALVFRGARAGGLRESGSLGFEAGSETVLPPDTLSGSTEAEAQKTRLTECYFRSVYLYWISELTNQP